METQAVVLASASPRRSEILARMGISFIVDAADVDESYQPGEAESIVKMLAKRKAEAVAARHPREVVLAADTVVVCDGNILGKPAGNQQAAEMLHMLADRWHQVYTGVCVARGGMLRCEAALTRVHFTPLTDMEIDRYIATGDPVDKAGAYAIQGMAGMFIDRIEGCPHNVMGLPMALTKEMLSC